MVYISIIKNELLNCMPHLREELAKEEEVYNNFWRLMKLIQNPDIKTFGEFTRDEIVLLRHRAGILSGDIKNYDEIADILNISIDDVNKIRQNAFLKMERVMRNGFYKPEFNPEDASKEFRDYYEIELMLRKQFLSECTSAMDENIAKVR